MRTDGNMKQIDDLRKLQELHPEFSETIGECLCYFSGLEAARRIKEHNERKTHPTIGSHGVITGEPDGMFKMPFYYGKLDNGDNIMFVFSIGEPEGKVGDRFEIYTSRGTDDGALLFGRLEKKEEKGKG